MTRSCSLKDEAIQMRFLQKTYPLFGPLDFSRRYPASQGQIGQHT